MDYDRAISGRPGVGAPGRWSAATGTARRTGAADKCRGRRRDGEWPRVPEQQLVRRAPQRVPSPCMIAFGIGPVDDRAGRAIGRAPGGTRLDEVHTAGPVANPGFVERREDAMPEDPVDRPAVEFDPFSDEYFNDPYDLYRRMRDEAPVYFNEKYGFWALFRYDDVCAAHKDWQTFSSRPRRRPVHARNDPTHPVYRSIIMMDPPEHDRHRALVSRVFTPRPSGPWSPWCAR